MTFHSDCDKNMLKWKKGWIDTSNYFLHFNVISKLQHFEPPLRLIHITAFSACVCGRRLRCSAEIEKFLSLRWRSPLWNPQTAAASVNEPLRLVQTSALNGCKSRRQTRVIICMRNLHQLEYFLNRFDLRTLFSYLDLHCVNCILLRTRLNDTITPKIQNWIVSILPTASRLL